jgi:transposase
LTIKDLKAKLKAIDKKIAALVEADPELRPCVARLLKVPGIGPVTATAVASRLIHKQFTNPDQFVAYIGMDITVVESGKRKGQLGLTKDGDAELRRLLYCAAQSSLHCKKDTTFRQQYAREKAKGHTNVQAICAITRKMAKLAWSITRHQADYDPKRVFAKTETKTKTKTLPANTRTASAESMRSAEPAICEGTAHT